jgi:hypothetical protein
MQDQRRYDMDIRSLEYQMDAFYALLSPIHIQIESEIYEPGQLYIPELKNISMNISAMLDGFRHCSELLNELRKEEQKLTGMCIDIAKEMDSSEVVPGMRVDNKPVKIATDGTTGEQYLTLQD